MDNWQKIVLSISLALAIGAGTRALEPTSTFKDCLRAGIAAVLPTLVGLKLTLDQTTVLSTTTLTVEKKEQHSSEQPPSA